MAWIAVYDSVEPYIFDDQTGEVIATCPRYKNMHEPPDYAWSRACVMAQAPALHHKLNDLIEHARRHFPEVLQNEITECELEIRKVQENYERRYTRPPGS